MKRIIITILAINTLVFSGFWQNQKPSFSLNPSLSFDKYISGIQYVEIGLNVLNQEKIGIQIGSKIPAPNGF